MIELNTRCIQLLRAIIWHERSRLPEQLKRSDNPKLYDQVWSNIHKLQDEISSYGMVRIGIALLNAGSEQVALEAMKLQISLLQGDNERVQEEWQKYFLNTREESFFLDAQRRLEDAMLSIKERRLLMAQFQKAVEKHQAAEATLLEGTIGKGAMRMQAAALANTEEEFAKLSPQTEEEDDQSADVDFR